MHPHDYMYWIYYHKYITMARSVQIQKDTNTLYSSLTVWLAGLILGFHPDNEECRYRVTPSLSGWAQA